MQVRLLNKSSNAYDTIDIKKLYKALSRADVVNDNIVIDGTHYELNSIQEDKFLIKGSIANADTNPDYPAAKKGDIYQITTIAGKVGGASGKDVDINDFIVCLADAVTGDEATVGTSWGAFERNVDLSSLISGDITMTDAGVATIGDNKVLTQHILANNVTESKISAPGAYGLNVLRTAKAQYNFSADGGVVGTITPIFNATIPNDAIMVGGIVNSTSEVTSAGAATVSVGTSAGSSEASILGATAKGSFTLDAMLNSVATFAAPVKMTAAGQITFTIATADLTAGVIEATVLYIVGIN